MKGIITIKMVVTWQIPPYSVLLLFTLSMEQEAPKLHTLFWHWIELSETKKERMLLLWNKQNIDYTVPILDI